MRRFAWKKDANHTEIVEALEKTGWEVIDLAQYGFPVDLYVLRGFARHWVEIKDGEKVPSKRKLTESAKKFKKILERHGEQVFVVECVDDVLQL